MSVLKMSDLHYPGGHKNRETIIRHTAQWAKSEQGTAASLATAALFNATPIDQPDKGGTLHLSFVSSALAATGESMTVDVLKNGVSVLSGVFTFNSTQPKGTQISLDKLINPGTTVKTGDVLTTTRVYTAGGSPTMTATVVRAEWSAAGENG